MPRRGLQAQPGSTTTRDFPLLSTRVVGRPLVIPQALA